MVEDRTQKPIKKPPLKEPADPPAAPKPDYLRARKPRAKVSLQRKSDSIRDCVYCKDSIDDTGHAWCLRCKTVLHKECADELGRCSSIGCPGEIMRYTPAALTPSEKGPPSLWLAGGAVFFSLLIPAIISFGFLLSKILSIGPAIFFTATVIGAITPRAIEIYREFWRVFANRRRIRRLLRFVKLSLVILGGTFVYLGIKWLIASERWYDILIYMGTSAWPLLSTCVLLAVLVGTRRWREARKKPESEPDPDSHLELTIEREPELNAAECPHQADESAGQ